MVYYAEAKCKTKQNEVKWGETEETELNKAEQGRTELNKAEPASNYDERKI